MECYKPGWSKTASMKGQITVWEKICGPQRGTLLQKKDMFAVLIYLIFVANLREFDSRVIANFFVCLFATQNKDFLLEKRYTKHTHKMTKLFFVFLVIKSMFAIISVVGRRKQACRFHQPFYFVCRFSIASKLKKHFRNLRTFSTSSVQSLLSGGNCPRFASPACGPACPSVISKLLPWYALSCSLL